MINPELNDWWSRKRLTTFKCNSTSLSGAGIPMNVLASAFKEKEFSWFSIVYGEFDDNLILVSMDNQTANKFHKVEYDDQDKKRMFFSRPWKNEYKITEEIASALGLITSNKGFEISNKSKFSFYIYSHDNFCFSIEPISSDLVRRVVLAVLNLHSYYLGEEIQWKEIEVQLTDIIMHNKEIDIQSDSKNHCLWIPQIECNKSWFWKKHRQGTIVINRSKASFRK